MIFLIYCIIIFLLNKENIFNFSDIFLSSIVPIFNLNNSNIKNTVNRKIQSFTLNPWYVTGYTDGEGSFVFSLVRSKSNKIGWGLLIHFNLVAANNPANITMLLAIQQFFGVGQIVYAKNNSYIRYIVKGLENCLILRNHFFKLSFAFFQISSF